GDRRRAARRGGRPRRARARVRPVGGPPARDPRGPPGEGLEGVPHRRRGDGSPGCPRQRGRARPPVRGRVASGQAGAGGAEGVAARPQGHRHQGRLPQGARLAARRPGRHRSGLEADPVDRALLRGRRAHPLRPDRGAHRLRDRRPVLNGPRSGGYPPQDAALRRADAATAAHYGRLSSQPPVLCRPVTKREPCARHRTPTPRTHSSPPPPNRTLRPRRRTPRNRALRPPIRRCTRTIPTPSPPTPRGATRWTSTPSRHPSRPRPPTIRTRPHRRSTRSRPRPRSSPPTAPVPPRAAPSRPPAPPASTTDR